MAVGLAETRGASRYTFLPVKNIQINGKPHSSQSANVAELLVELRLSGKPVAVERNGDVVPKRIHGQTPVAEGDVFELVTLVGGG